MKALRDTWTELVERRLWPVALLLVAALVAVPLLLAKKPSADVASAGAGAPPAAAPRAGAAGEPIVSLASGPGADAAMLGRAKNPFHQQHVPHRQQVTATASAGGPASGGSTGATGATGGTTGGGSGGAAPVPAPQPRTYVYASIDVRFGQAGGRLRRIENVPRLAPLPDSGDPVVVFLGTRRDHETAAFLVSTDVHAQGDGTCVPDAAVCQAIELRAGQVALLDVRAADGSITQYELDLDRVTLHRTTSKATAQAAYARVSRAGSRMLRRLVRSSSLNTTADAPRLRIPFRYAPRSGVLHIAPYLSRRLTHGSRVHLRADARAVTGTRPGRAALTPLP